MRGRCPLQALARSLVPQARQPGHEVPRGRRALQQRLLGAVQARGARRGQARRPQAQAPPARHAALAARQRQAPARRRLAGVQLLAHGGPVDGAQQRLLGHLGRVAQRGRQRIGAAVEGGQRAQDGGRADRVRAARVLGEELLVQELHADLHLLVVHGAEGVQRVAEEALEGRGGRAPWRALVGLADETASANKGTGNQSRGGTVVETFAREGRDGGQVVWACIGSITPDCAMKRHTYHYETHRGVLLERRAHEKRRKAPERRGIRTLLRQTQKRMCEDIVGL